MTDCLSAAPNHGPLRACLASEKTKGPRAGWRGGKASPLPERVPEDRHDIQIVLSGSPAEVGVNLRRAELGRCKGQRDVGVAAGLAGPVPTAADLHAVLGADPEVGLRIALLTRDQS